MQLSLKLVGTTVRQWFDSDHFPEGADVVRRQPDRFEWRRALPFVFLHVGCLGVIWVGFSWTAAGVALGSYLLRMFAITAFYHRYFAHRTFSTSRAAQFVFAALGNLAVQRGALWWASIHRHHHRHADRPPDAHSPVQYGFWWSHIGWLTSSRNYPTNYTAIRDLATFPELVFLNRFDLIVPGFLVAVLYASGTALKLAAPGLGTSGGQLVVWGFFVSTVVLLHGTLMINSLAHVFGTRRFPTRDASRNNPLLALLTLGEGWHNNHHRYMGSTRQGFYWWEVDLTYYALRIMSWCGLIWDLRPVPESVYREHRMRGEARAHAS